MHVLAQKEEKFSNVRRKEDANSQGSKHICQPSGWLEGLLYPVVSRGLGIYAHRGKEMKSLDH